eukprot:gene2397-4649_t
MRVESLISPLLLVAQSIICECYSIPYLKGMYSTRANPLTFRKSSHLCSTAKSGLLLSPSDFDAMSIGMPRVLPPSKEDDNVWQLWFHGRDSSFPGDLVNTCTGKIFYATSEDGISNWKAHPDSPVLLPSSAEGNWWWFDSTHVGLGDIITPGQEAQAKFRIQGGIYMMYIFGGNQDTVELTDKDGRTNTVRGSKMEIGVAVSQDGAHWSRVEGPSAYGAIVEAGDPEEYDAQFVGWPCIVSMQSEVRMYYNTYCPRNKKFIVGVATSKDGIKFKKLGAVFNGGPAGKFDSMGANRRHVVKLENGEYRMWYEAVSSEGRHSIGLATSLDGMQWERVGDEPVFSPNEDADAWDAGGVGSPHVVWLPEKQRWRLYYMGTSLPDKIPIDYTLSTQSAIGIAESIDEMGLSFERLTAVPPTINFIFKNSSILFFHPLSLILTINGVQENVFPPPPLFPPFFIPARLLNDAVFRNRQETEKFILPSKEIITKEILQTQDLLYVTKDLGGVLSLISLTYSRYGWQGLTQIAGGLVFGTSKHMTILETVQLTDVCVTALISNSDRRRLIGKANTLESPKMILKLSWKKVRGTNAQFETIYAPDCITQLGRELRFPRGYNEDRLGGGGVSF